jgi:hypothetical protein
MLKPTDAPPGGNERPIGELVSQLVEDGKAYARAEADLVKAIAAAKARAVTTPVVLLVVAVFVAMAALNALCVGIVLSLATLVGPLAATIITFVVIGGIAGALTWLGVSKLRKVL